MKKLFLIFFCGLPFSCFIFNQPDIWHGQGHFFALGILVLLSWSFFEKPRYVQVMNKPLGLLLLWIGLLTIYTWIKVLTISKNYPVKVLLPFINFLCFIIFYKLSLEYLDKEAIEKILKYLKYSILIILFYCVLQVYGLDQFLKGLSGHSELVGTVGNPSHLAGYLALCQILFFKKERLNILALIMLWLILIMTNSASGVIVGIAILLFYLLMKRRYIFSGIIGGLCLLSLPFLNYKFFTFSHRLELWKILYEKFSLKAITGSGLGVMNFWQPKPQTSIWRHAHQAYYQVAVEIGIIGLVVVIWCIWEYFSLFKTFKTDLTIKLASIFFGFCILGLFTFSAHLWLISALGMFSYSGLYTLKNEVM